MTDAFDPNAPVYSRNLTGWERVRIPPPGDDAAANAAAEEGREKNRSRRFVVRI